MSDKVSAFIEKLIDLGASLVDAAGPLAAKAAEASLAAVQIRGMTAVGSGIVCVVGACVAYRASLYFWRAAGQIVEERGRRYDDERHFAHGVGGFLTGIASGLLAINAGMNLLAGDTWMALLRPDAYLAAKALGL